MKAGATLPCRITAYSIVILTPFKQALLRRKELVGGAINKKAVLPRPLLAQVRMDPSKPFDTFLPPCPPQPVTQTKCFTTHNKLTQTVSLACRNDISAQKVRKLHIALKLGTKTGTEDYVHRAGPWYRMGEQILDKLLFSCLCKRSNLSQSRQLSPVCSPEYRQQTLASMDAIFFDPSPYPLFVGRATGSSEVRFLHY